MSWTDQDDIDLQESYDRLVAKQKELQDELTPIQMTINNTRQIQTREITSYTEDRVPVVTKIPPKDQWDDDISDNDRLEIKDQCIAKTIELLGEPVE